MLKYKIEYFSGTSYGPLYSTLDIEENLNRFNDIKSCVQEIFWRANIGSQYRIVTTSKIEVIKIEKT